jgi:hypothetical protein
MHTALWVLAAVSLVGVVVCLLRPSHLKTDAEDLDGHQQAHIALEAVAELRIGAHDAEFDDGAIVGQGRPRSTVAASLRR